MPHAELNSAVASMQTYHPNRHPNRVECGRLLSPEVLTAKSNHALLLYALGKRAESAALYSDVLQQAAPRRRQPELASTGP